MAQKAYVLVFDGLADWETALVASEINRSPKAIEVVTTGFTEGAVTTMGGFAVVPQATIDRVSAEDAAIFILPGGDRWEQGPIEEGLISLLQRLHAQGVPVAAICGATIAAGQAGLLDDARHTSNARLYLDHFLPEYGGQALYVEDLAVTDNNVITASGLGYVEFAREIFKRLEVFSEADLSTWFQMFKHGVMPRAVAEAVAESLNNRG